MAEAEIMHRPRHSPNIVRVTGPYQHNYDAIEKFNAHIAILGDKK